MDGYDFKVIDSGQRLVKESFHPGDILQVFIDDPNVFVSRKRSYDVEVLGWTNKRNMVMLKFLSSTYQIGPTESNGRHIRVIGKYTMKQPQANDIRILKTYSTPVNFPLLMVKPGTCLRIQLKETPHEVYRADFDVIFVRQVKSDILGQIDWAVFKLVDTDETNGVEVSFNITNIKVMGIYEKVYEEVKPKAKDKEDLKVEPKTSINIEVGKTYKTTNGYFVSITGKDKSWAAVFHGDNGRSYVPNGMCLGSPVTFHDLVEELIDESIIPGMEDIDLSHKETKPQDFLVTLQLAKQQAAKQGFTLEVTLIPKE